MHVHTVETIAIAVAVIVYVTYRQSQWQSVRASKLLRTPVIFLAAAVVTLVGSHLPAAGLHLHTVDVVILGSELVAGFVVGWLMGRWTEIEVVDGVTRSRLRGAGVAVWVGFIGLRIALGFGAAMLGATVASQPATALLMIAVVKTIQVVLIRERLRRPTAVARPSAYVAGRS